MREPSSGGTTGRGGVLVLSLDVLSLAEGRGSVKQERPAARSDRPINTAVR